MGRKSAVPWTDDAITYLIKLYGQNMEQFMCQYRNQKRLWVQLVEIMKQNNKLPLKIRETITDINVGNKWRALIQKFKYIFYKYTNVSPDDSVHVNFPHYNQMYKLFIEYAAAKLNQSISNDSFNITLDPNISQYVKNLLNLTETSFEDVEKENDEAVPSISRAEKIVEKMREMPKGSLKVYETTMRIEQNTPFRRQYGISTIINQKNKIKPLKRENPDKKVSENKFKIQKIEKISMKNQSSMSGSFEYEIEALDECSFIQNKVSKSSSNDSSNPIFVSKDELTILEVSDETSKTEIENKIKLPKSIVVRKIEPKKPETSFVVPKGVVIKRQTMKSESSINNSMDVPSLTESFDDLRAQSTPHQQPRGFIAIDQTGMRRTSNIVPKKLTYESDFLTETPPGWFSDFVKKYEADQKRTEEKLDKIDKMLTQVIQSQKVSPTKVLMSPRVIQIKKGY